MATKTYMSAYKHHSIVIDVAGKKKRINLEGGMLDLGGMYTTANKDEQDAIESLKSFGDGNEIFIHRVYEGEAQPEVKTINVQKSESDIREGLRGIIGGGIPPVDTEGPSDLTIGDDINEGDDTGEGGNAKSDTTENTGAGDDKQSDMSGIRIVEEVTTVQAGSIFLSQEYGVARTSVNTKDKLLAKAAELNVSFPNIAQ